MREEEGEDEEKQKTEKDKILNLRLFRQSYINMENEDDIDIKMEL